MLAVRRALFGLAGGFAMTDFYINCVRLSDVQFEPPPQTSSGGRGAGLETVARVLGIIASPSISPHTPLREDIEDLLQGNRAFSLLFLLTMVSFGGIWSLLGSSTAIAFDGEDGARRYTALKEWLNR